MIASTIVSRAREVYGDSDTTNPGVSDAILFDLINAYVRALWKINPRPVSRTSSALGWTISASTKSALTDDIDIISWLGLYREASNSVAATGTPLRKMSPARILQLQIEETTEGTVTRYSVEREATTTEASQGLWRARFHPIPSATTHISARVIAEPETIDAGADGVDLDDEEGYGISKVLALHAAPMVRQPAARIQEIRASIPAKFLAIYQEIIGQQMPMGERV